MYDCKYQVVNGVSKKGNEYSRLDIYFSNGYVLQVFLDNAQKFCVNDAAVKDGTKAAAGTDEAY